MKFEAMYKESAIQKLILDWLAANQFCHWRNYVGAIIRGNRENLRFGKNPAKGMPDIMGLMKDGTGRLFAIEVKTPKGTLQPHQKQKIAELNENGAVAFVARDLDTVIERLG